MIATVVNSFFELHVEPYRLAVPARIVLGVLDSVGAGADTVPFRERPLRWLDLRTRIAERPHTAIVPLVLVVETSRGAFGLGIDQVATAPIPDTTPLIPVPGYGLHYPELFKGVLRWDNRLVMALDVDAVARLANAA